MSINAIAKIHIYTLYPDKVNPVTARLLYGNDVNDLTSLATAQADAPNYPGSYVTFSFGTVNPPAGLQWYYLELSCSGDISEGETLWVAGTAFDLLIYYSYLGSPYTLYSDEGSGALYNGGTFLLGELEDIGHEALVTGDLIVRIVLGQGNLSSNPPEKPINPTPSDAAINQDLDLSQISWEDGGDAETYDVYFGVTGTLTKVSSSQESLSFSLSAYHPLLPETEYTWRVDSKNSDGTTTGDEWTFNTTDGKPKKAINPTPEDAISSQSIWLSELSWEVGT